MFFSRQIINSNQCAEQNTNYYNKQSVGRVFMLYTHMREIPH